MAHRSPQDINQRLEHYVFGIASQFIARVDASTQQALVDAASRFIIIANSDSTNTAVPGSLLPDLVSPPHHQQLDLVTDQRLAHRQWLAGWLHQQRQYQLQHITRLENALLVTQQHYQQIQATVLREPYRTRLLHRCRRSLAHFQQCLDSAYSMSQSTTSWLDRLTHDKAV